MVHKRYCSSAKALHPAQAIQWDKCNLTRFSTNFRFEDFSWMLATENAVAGHMRTAGLYLDHTDVDLSSVLSECKCLPLQWDCCWEATIFFWWGQRNGLSWERWQNDRPKFTQE